MMNGATQTSFKFLFEHIKVPNNIEIDFDPHRLLKSSKQIKILWAHYNCDQPLYLNVDWEKINHIVCVSNWEKNEFLIKLKIPESKISVIRNGGANYFIPNHKKKKSKTLIYTSTPFRGLKYLPKIFKKVLEKHPDTNLKIFSGMNLYGLNDDSYNHIYDELKKLPNTTYSKAVEHKELIKHYQNSLIFCYPNTWEETSCVSLIEAMRCGCYPIITNIGALPETSCGFGTIVNIDGINTKNGWELTDDCVENFSNEVVKVLNYYDYDEKISAFSCDFYDWGKISKEWLFLFEKMIGKKMNDIEKFKEKNTFEIADDKMFLDMAYNEVFKWENYDKEHAQGRSNFQIEKFIALDSFTIASTFSSLLKNRKSVAEGLLNKVVEITKRKRGWDRKLKEIENKTQEELDSIDHDLDVILYETYMKNAELEIRDRTQQIEFFDKLLDELIKKNGGPITREQFEKEDHVYWERRFANQAYDDMLSKVTGISHGNIHSIRRSLAPTLLDDDVNRVKEQYPDLTMAVEKPSQFILELQNKVYEGINEVTGKNVNLKLKTEEKKLLKTEDINVLEKSPKSLFNENLLKEKN